MIESIEQMDNWNDLRLQVLDSTPSKEGEHVISILDPKTMTFQHWNVRYNTCVTCHIEIDWNKTIICNICKPMYTAYAK